MRTRVIFTLSSFCSCPPQAPLPSEKQSCSPSPPPRSGPAARSAPRGSHRGLLKSKKQSYTSHPSPPETMEGEKLRHLLKIPFILCILFIIVTFRILVVIPGNWKPCPASELTFPMAHLTGMI